MAELEEEKYELQNQLDVADRKAQIKEADFQKLSRAHDLAVSELSSLFIKSQGFENTIHSLRRENEELKTRLVLLSRNASIDDDNNNTGQASMSAGSTTDDSTRSQEDTRTQLESQVNQEIARRQRENANVQQQQETRSTLHLHDPSNSENVRENTAPAKHPNGGKQRVKRVIVEEVDDSSVVAQDDYTMLSAMNVGEMCHFHFAGEANHYRPRSLPPCERESKRGGLPRGSGVSRVNRLLKSVSPLPLRTQLANPNNLQLQPHRRRLK